MTNSLLKTVDRTREFGRLSELFEDTSNRTLLESLRGLPELDVELLSRCLSEEVRHYKPYLRPDDLTPGMIGRHVTDWIESSKSLLREAATKALAKESQLANLMRLDKDIRNELDEASQERIYDILRPAIQQHVSDLLEGSISWLCQQKNSLQRVIESSCTSHDLWSNKLQWSRGSLANFKIFTKKSVRGDSGSFVAFDRAYQPVIRIIAENLEVLAQFRDYHSQRKSYVESVDKCFREWYNDLYLIAEGTSENGTIIAVLRLLLFLDRTNPVHTPTVVQTGGIYKKLVPVIELEAHTSTDYQKTFEGGLPTGPTSTVIDHLMLISSAVAAAGIDIAGVEERAVVREVITASLERYSKTRELQESSDRETTNHGNTVKIHGLYGNDGDGDDKQDVGDVPEVSTGQQVMDKSDMTDPDASGHDEASTTDGNDKHKLLDANSGPHDHQISALAQTQTGTTSTTNNHAASLQMYFDCKFVYGLLKLEPSEHIDKLYRESEVPKSMEQNIQKAVMRNRVLFGAIID
ncbi:protein of unknown function [Taphrina deformans PYCC 5710]|uniref:Uncharacterized protein n=1 Tax=Taphrina deformans (strain PYCC 5710 / ATCC 11124 / CBS 356.35 / IMI 108563 / JCM 9778 / NBRC 8474) TaxID=1097556 RepID=R4XPQ8_TAPDE|nr:protein of unknown function [Taphrina deformans PYCC 5710]|eukprot:CCG85161.1 protein of unknown function [Taphrina deformans PYCC 5710]